MANFWKDELGNHWFDWPQGGVRDTLVSLKYDKDETLLKYLSGKNKQPHYPVPAIPIEVEYYPDPLIVMIQTTAVKPDRFAEEHHWKTVWRSDNRIDWC